MDRVLIIEDDEDFARTLRDVLRFSGIAADVAYDGVTALAKLADDRAYDCVVMDLAMPTMSGEEILAAHGRSDVPFVILTAYPERAARLDVAAVLAKPVTLEALVGAVRGASRGAQRAARRTLSVVS